MADLTHNAYGKSDIRLTKVVRNGSKHELFEIVADVLLEGDFAAAYTHADNRLVVATDTIKNFVYIKAKEHSFKSLEEFAIILADEYLATYSHISQATVELTRGSWARIAIDGNPHDHAFTDGGRAKRYAKAIKARGDAAPTLTGGVRGLLVLKTTASEWRDFHTDRHRSLKDTSDRIMATQIDADWAYNVTTGDFDARNRSITDAILKMFANEHSLGVQQTLKQMGDAALAACSAIDSITFDLPNLHRIPFNLDPFGLKFENDIYIATEAPYGVIKGTITRSGQ